MQPIDPTTTIFRLGRCHSFITYSVVDVVVAVAVLVVVVVVVVVGRVSSSTYYLPT